MYILGEFIRQLMRCFVSRTIEETAIKRLEKKTIDIWEIEILNRNIERDSICQLINALICLWSNNWGNHAAKHAERKDTGKNF